jgi:hypothetical protein
MPAAIRKGYKIFMRTLLVRKQMYHKEEISLLLAKRLLFLIRSFV